MSQYEDIFSITGYFLEPYCVKQLSSTFNLSNEEVEKNLRLAIPTFLSTLIYKTATPEGAQDIFYYAKSNKFHPYFMNDSHLTESLPEGKKAVEKVFKNTPPLDDFFPQIKKGDLNKIEEFMSLIAPSVMEVLKGIIKENNMNPEDLSYYLQKQKKALKGFTHKEMSAQSTISKAIQKTLKDKINKSNHFPPAACQYGKRRTSSLFVILFFFSLIILSFWGLFSRSKSVEKMRKEILAVYQAQQEKKLFIKDLSSFIVNATTEDLPQVFYFEDLAFIKYSTDRKIFGVSEIDKVSEVMKKNPTITITLEGFIEDTGKKEENLIKSENRAIIIKEELVSRGIAPLRIKTTGRGLRKSHHQIKLIVTKM